MSKAITFDPYATYTVRDDSNIHWQHITRSDDYFRRGTDSWCIIRSENELLDGTLFRQELNKSIEHTFYVRDVFLPACAHRWENSPICELDLVWSRLEAVVFDQLEAELSEREGFFSTFVYDKTFHETPRWKCVLTNRKDRSDMFVDFLESQYDRSNWRVDRDFLEELARLIAQRYLIDKVRCPDDRQAAVVAQMLSGYRETLAEHALNLMWQESLTLNEFETITRYVKDRGGHLPNHLTDDRKQDVKAFAVNNIERQSYKILSKAVRDAVSISGQPHVALDSSVIEKCLNLPVDHLYADSLSNFWHRLYNDKVSMALSAMYFLKYDEDTKRRVKNKVLGILQRDGKGLSHLLNDGDKALIVRMGYRIEDIIVEYK